MMGEIALAFLEILILCLIRGEKCLSGLDLEALKTKHKVMGTVVADWSRLLIHGRAPLLAFHGHADFGIGQGKDSHYPEEVGKWESVVLDSKPLSSLEAPLSSGSCCVSEGSTLAEKPPVSG